MIQITNRLDQLFQLKKKDILSIYYTAGFPELHDTPRIAEYLQQAGADIVEIGMPFSDPLADGPTIQQSSLRALNNGMTIRLLFEQIKDIRQKVDIPIILMGYLNPAMQYGLERFCEQCQKAGVDALILPDLPMQEYLDEYRGLFESYGLYNIFLISPQTSDARIHLIDENSHGFIYMVSSASITGAKSGITDEQVAYFKRVEDMGLKHPTLIGFGISNHATFAKACQYSSGAIIGSAFIRALEKSQNLQEDVLQFVKGIREGA
ncbi:MAG: tryptophan synthase subunit alpha [Cyclobacteriaceae bacterium]